MECISVFDMLKIGIGPSSSHTLGPWRAAEQFLIEIQQKNMLENVTRIQVDLYGSLSLTGYGHATDLAVMLGLSGQDPEYIPVDQIQKIIDNIKNNKTLNLAGQREIFFDDKTNIIFNREFLPFHANGITFTAITNKETHSVTFYSIGGGFVVKETADDNRTQAKYTFPYPIEKADELLEYCRKESKKISEIVYENEKSMRNEAEIDHELIRIWHTMLECMYIGCHTEGTLPGGLNVRRRAYDMHRNLKGELPYSNPQEWMETIRKTEVKFRQILKWVSCFALAVNEVNASLGRVVTAPTNGSAGV
ncbi:MAG TPA: serine dehydratase beta chain, partial [Flavobacterium sp.]|nr:serine dehydratase beta chain [Flavobacterium sp.]